MGQLSIDMVKLRCREDSHGADASRQLAAGSALDLTSPDHLWSMVSPLILYTPLTEGREDGIGLWKHSIKILVLRLTYYHMGYGQNTPAALATLSVLLNPQS